MQSPLYSQIMYVFWDLLPPYQRITIKLPYIAATPHPPLALSLSHYLTCKNVQKTSYLVINTIILYYYGMFSYGGIFTFSITAVFSPGQGCVLLKRKPPNLNHRFHTNPINCVKFSHNSLKIPKITSTPTSIKPLYFLVKLNCRTI